jgi:hypothetical protein
MNPPNKKSPAASRIPLGVKHQPKQPHPFKPVVVQSKNSVTVESSKRQVVPPAYRPAPKLSAAQTKMAAASLSKTQLAGTPISRAQPASLTQLRHPPRPWRNQAGPPVAQAKMAQAIAGHDHGVIQRTKCWLWMDGRLKAGDGPQGSFEAKPHTPKENHAERQAWRRHEARGREAKIIKFEVDQSVCTDCQAWLKTTFMQRELRGKEVKIEVKGRSVQLGDGMNWEGVGDIERPRVVLADPVGQRRREREAARRGR